MLEQRYELNCKRVLETVAIHADNINFVPLVNHIQRLIYALGKQKEIGDSLTMCFFLSDYKIII